MLQIFTLAALVRRSPLSPTEMLRTSFWTLISLIGLFNFFSDAYRKIKVKSLYSANIYKLQRDRENIAYHGAATVVDDNRKGWEQR